MAKAKKKRADTYEKPVKIQGTFGDVIKVAMANPDKPKEKSVKPPKKGK